MRLIAILPLIFLGAFWLGSQEYSIDFRKIDMADGLSHYNAHCFFAENDAIWIGTEDGLNYFDGFNWKYWKKEEGQISNNDVNELFRDDSGNFWLFSNALSRANGLLQSIDILEPGRDSAHTFEAYFGPSAPFKVEDIQHYFQGAKNELYFVTAHHFWQYTPEKAFHAIHLPKAFEPKGVFVDSMFYGLTDGYLTLINQSGWVLFMDAEPLPEVAELKVVGDKDQFWLWKHPYDPIEFRYNKKTDVYSRSLVELDSGFSSSEYQLLQYDEERKVCWIKRRQMVYAYDTDWEKLAEYPAIGGSSYLDQHSHLWVGRVGVTVLKLVKQPFKRYLYQDTKPGISPQDKYKCRGILDFRDHIIINTYRSTQVLNRESGEIIKSFPNLNRNFLVFEEDQKGIWLMRKTAYILDNELSKVSEIIPKESPEDKYWCHLKDHRGRLWFGGVGLSWFDGQKIRVFDQYNSFGELRNAVVLNLYKDRNGVIWVVSNQGLYILDPDRGVIDHFGKKRRDSRFLPANRFQHMYQDANGIYWLASEDQGLIRWDRSDGTFRVFDKSHGFLSNNIYAVYEDDFGFLWLSSFNGLIRFDKTQEKALVFTEEDGISCNEFNRISHWQAKDGRLFFGGQNGVTSFHPRDFLGGKKSQKNFDLWIKHKSVFGEKNYKDTLHNGDPLDLTNLDAGVNVIDLELACNNLFWTDRLHIQYALEKLEGGASVNLSRDYITSDNHVELFGMTPGNYMLKIQAIQTNGKPIGKELRIPIGIKRPFVQTPAFFALLVFGLLSIAWIAIRYRTSWLKRRAKVLEKLVEERTARILKDQKTIRSQAEQIAEMRDQLNEKDQLWLKQFENIINERLQDTNLDLPAIIEDMDIGRSHFFEKVKALTNMTPNQYIQERRLVRAKEMIEKGEADTIKQVALAVGIRRPSYFSKLFKERFGLLPSDFFRRHKN